MSVSPPKHKGSAMNEINFNDQHLIDPDPVTVAITTLGAVASVVTIISYIDQVKDRRKKEDIDNREILSELIDLSSKMEAALIDIDAAINKLSLFPTIAKMYDGLQINETENGKIPFKVGAITLNLPPQQFKDFANTHKRISSGCHKVVRDIYTIMQVLYKARIELDPDLYEQLVSLRANVNRALQGSLTYDKAFKLYIRVVSQAKEIAKDLKESFILGPENTPKFNSPGMG